MSGDGVTNPADLSPVIAALIIIDAIVDDILVDTTAIVAALIVIDGIVDTIEAVTSALPTLTSMVGTTTTTTVDTEYDLYILAAPLGVYKPELVTVNFLNQTASETVILRTYRRDTDGGVWSLLDETTPIIGVQDPVLLKILLNSNRFGIRTTIERTVGTARGYPWAAFYEI